MNMKFMKRKEETNMQSKEDASKRRRLLDNNTAGAKKMDVEVALAAPTPPHDRSAALVCTVETTDLYSALPGRRSFGGFNKVIERNYAILMDQQSGDIVPTPDEEQILRQYESLVSLPRGPGQGKGKGKREGSSGGQAGAPDKQPRKDGKGGQGGKAGGGGRADNPTVESNPYLPSKFSSSKKHKGGNKAH